MHSNQHPDSLTHGILVTAWDERLREAQNLMPNQYVRE
jgi:hypothetical protein